ncbi:hexose transporter protein [Sodiomyces alkalinus F11]|uniref:Hexose transporter protein n=1 Tax=Sodiomyces alkalinus (strain CBS 110278 / VKM F-3762 / F11) TaxID=1314773 RepID=A0A3N2PL77_SODAK|nr:hexose transporter protein [Sodiomyces alkalinus F11]ROT35277.1 hexose transporter protein [Sodiomyces alkalinus F11]
MGRFTYIKQAKPTAESRAAALEEAPKFERVVWHQDPGLRKLYFYAVVLCVSSASTGYDGMFFNGIQNFESWTSFFGYPSGSDLGLLVALYQIGSVASIPFVPIITDNWGRRLSIAIGFVIMIVGAVMQGSAQDYGTFAGGRVLLGFGNSFAQIASPMLLTEICHPQHRARLTTVYNCLWNLGALIVAWTTFGTNFMNNEWSWRIPAILQGAPSFLQLLFLWWVPESPRFLIAKDRHDEALAILAKYHANGDSDNPTVQFEFREIRDTIKLEQVANTSTKYVDFFKTKGNRYRLMVIISLGIFSQWSGNAIISNYTAILYANAGISDSVARLGLNAGSTSMSMIVSISFALMVDRLGRRPTFLLATGGMCGTLVVWTLTCGLYEQHNAPGSNHALIFFIWLFQFFYSTAWSGLLIGYAVEVLPYSLRAKGLMILNIMIQVALLLNNYANPLALEAWAGDPDTGLGGNTWRLYLIYSIWVFLELCFVYFMYVETRGPTLEELVKVIDGPDANVAAIDLGQVEKEHNLQAEGEHTEETVQTPVKN